MARGPCNNTEELEAEVEAAPAKAKDANNSTVDTTRGPQGAQGF